jgi:hypothetical protein
MSATQALYEFFEWNSLAAEFTELLSGWPHDVPSDCQSSAATGQRAQRTYPSPERV